MDLEPSLQFYARQATLHFGVNGEGPTNRSITLTTELAGKCEVITQTGRTLQPSQWSVQLIEKESFSEEAKAEQAIGLLWHSPEYQSDNDYLAEACSASVAVDRTTFQTLYETLRTGKLPSFISVSVRGLTYDWDPDGHTKVWDVDAARHLYITDISITDTLVSAEQERPEEEIEQPVHLATSADAYAIRQEVTTAIVQMQDKVIAQTRWLVWIGVGILILLTTHFK